ncbi:MAG: Bug family tripartite tricarboxylate transporter substrate binding protein [Xanthobacteraceae bacterium]
MLCLKRAHLSTIVAFIALTLLVATPAVAQNSIADFYKGKTVTILMGTGPGGSYDLYGRVIGMHLGRHIPGNPNIIIEHMPGAGGAIAGNHIYGVGVQDGTRILLAHAIPLAEKLQPGPGIRFETRKMHWLGAYDAIAQGITTWHTLNIKTLDDLKKAEFAVGAFNKNHLTYQWAALTKLALGAKYKIVVGYRSGNSLNLAMERGEIGGWVASYENQVGTRPHWVAEKKVKTFVQCTLERIPGWPDIPTLAEITPAANKDVVEFMVSATPIARAMAVGPGVPKDRAAALRKAFADTMKDPAFLADAKKRKLQIHPRTGPATQALVDKIVGASPELVARVKKAIQ